MRGLAGKVAVVVGGAGGIGSATCVRLADEGCAVAVGDLDGAAADEVAERIRAAGGRALARQTDIGDEEQVRALVGEAVAEFGGLDVLHANAADLSAEVIGRDSNVVEIPLDAFDGTIRAGGAVTCSVPGTRSLGCSSEAAVRSSSRARGVVVWRAATSRVRHVEERDQRAGSAHRLAVGEGRDPGQRRRARTRPHGAELRRPRG